MTEQKPQEHKVCPLMTIGAMVATQDVGLYDSRYGPGSAMYCEQEKCQLWWLCSGDIVTEVHPDRQATEVLIVHHGGQYGK